MIVEVQKERHEIKVTSKVAVSVFAPGDIGFVRPGQYLEAKGILTNERVFLSEVSIFLVAKGKRPPAGQVVKAQDAEGQSVNAHLVSGPILELKADEDYPSLQRLEMKFNGDAPLIMLEEGCKVWVHHYDPSTAPADADVEMTVKPLKGGKFTPLTVKIYRDAPFDSAEVFKAEEPSTEATNTAEKNE